MENIIGQKFNYLTIIENLGKDKWYKIRVICLCDCGNKKELYFSHIKTGNTKSCGCYQIKMGHDRAKQNKTHGMSSHNEYKIYCSAKDRCENQNNKAYDYYGGRGIQFKFKTFEEFYNEVGLRPSKEYSIDRIDVNGHYERGNIRWATPKEQANNKRHRIIILNDRNGDRKLAFINNIPYNTIYARRNKGWCEECIIKPVTSKGRCPHNWKERLEKGLL